MIKYCVVDGGSSGARGLMAGMMAPAPTSDIIFRLIAHLAPIAKL